MPRGTSGGTKSSGRKLLAGSWWRASAYEIRSGYIRPCLDAIFEQYNPWEIFNEKKQKRTRSEAPYQSLIRIARECAPFKNGERWMKLDQNTGQAIVGWCSQHGLLGLLLASTHTTVLAPRWGNPTAMEKRKPGEEIPPVLTPQSVRFTRVNGGWSGQGYGRVLGPHTLTKRYSKKSEGQPLPKRMWPSDLPRPHALVDSIVGFPGDWQEEPLSQTWATFFPDVPKRNRETYQYPHPGTLEFFKSYGEPVEQFLTKAMELEEICNALFSAKLWLQSTKSGGDRSKFFECYCRYREVFVRPGRRDREREAENFEFIRRTLGKADASLVVSMFLALEWINRLVGSVAPLLVLDREGFRQNWQMGALLNSLAMMMLQDLTGESMVKSCPIDGSLFSVRSASWTEYCSEKCAETAKKRRSRARKAS